MTACGGGSSSGGHPSAAGQRQALEEAVRAYSDAFLGGDGQTAYAMLSERCQVGEDPAEYRSLVHGANLLYGDLTIKTLTVDSLTGTTGFVTYSYGNRHVDQHHQRWSLEDGAWQWDNC